MCGSYNHSRNDEEVYKEFLEIANDIIPQILRMEHSSRQLTRDPAAYALLLRFYDGLCCWEEDSQTPVLHITWATHMLSSIGKFDSEARTSVKVLDSKPDDDNSAGDNKMAGDKTSLSTVNGSSDPKLRDLRTHRRSKRTGKSHRVPLVGKPQSPEGGLGSLQVAAVEFCESGGSSEVSPVGMDSQLTPSSDKLKMNLVVEELAHQSDENDDDADDDGVRSLEIDALAHACSESLLNPDFLRGGGEPFVKDMNHQLLSSATSTQMDLSAFVASANSAGIENSAAVVSSEQISTLDISAERGPRLVLRSVKMSALKQLFVASKLNSSAIKLHLTAQSQVARKPSAHIRRPLSTHFYSDDRHRRAVKRGRRADD